MSIQHTRVIIVGGSLVGLSASLFLSWRGVPHVLVDKHLGSSPHPRAMGFTERTLEQYRAVGIAERIPRLSGASHVRRAKVESLTGPWLGETPWTPGGPARAADLSPTTGAAIAQDLLEPILRSTAQEHGAEHRLGVTLLSFEQSDDAVVAQLRPRSGPDYLLSADYLLAADGAESMIRESLGIGRSGVGHLRTIRSVLFTCPDADPYLARGVHQFEIDQPGFRAFLTSYCDGRWVLMLDDDRERSEHELAQAVLRALGADLPFRIITTGSWELAGRIADAYARGRVFLLGDAAHQLPPTRGGFGANTGIDDAWNLAWKLERLLAGRSALRLLDSYDAERRPIGWLRHQQTFARPDYARWLAEPAPAKALFDDDAMELGQLMRSAAVLGAGLELPGAASPRVWCGQPGTRAPHLWITRAGQRLSTLDLFGRGYVLVSHDVAWRSAASALPEVQVVVAGSDITVPDDFAEQLGVGTRGASLIRPDGIVAWRTREAADAAELARVFRAVACVEAT